LNRAKQLSAGFAIKVWERDRRVIRLEPKGLGFAVWRSPGTKDWFARIRRRRRGIRANVKISLCDKCDKLDAKIEPWGKPAIALSDQFTLDAMDDLIKKIEAQKAQFHPEQKP
jgi:hypothetical protein